MLLATRTTVDVPGEPHPLSQQPVGIEWVDVIALATNSRIVFVGGADVRADTDYETGIPLWPGEKVRIDVAELSEVYVDALVADEGVTSCAKTSS